MKKDPKKSLPSRRYFLTMAAFAVGTGITGKAKAMDTSPKGETVKMLTPDGKLVEVQKSVLDKAQNRKKASNKDILAWRESPENRKK
jgi:hypothetical protein